MSTPAHIWFTDENNAPVLGECLMPTRLGSTELKSFNHSVWIPTSSNTGKLTGTRLHVPITFEKEIDRITPYLFRAVDNEDLASIAPARYRKCAYGRSRTSL